MRHPLVLSSKEIESLEVVTSSFFLVLQGARPLLAQGPARPPLATAWGTDYLDKVVGGFPITLGISVSLKLADLQ